MEFDIERFIFEIENRPAIWNIKCHEYSDRTQKVKQWEEILQIFSERNASVEEKKYQEKILQKRWRSLRDAFVKQRRELAMSGSAATNKKTYKYYQQLLFLLPVVAINTKDNSMASEDDNDPLDIDRPHCSNRSLSKPKKFKKNDPTDKIGSELLDVLKSTLEQKNQEEDPDRQFMLSLVSELKRVPQKLKPRVKMNILKCIVEAQDQENDQQEELSADHSYSILIQQQSTSSPDHQPLSSLKQPKIEFIEISPTNSPTTEAQTSPGR